MGNLFLGASPGSSSSPAYRSIGASDVPVIFTTGNVYYIDPVNGSDGNAGNSPGSAVQSLAAGYALLVSGHNDVLVIIGNGATGGAVRLTAGFTWAKSAAHMMGMCPPGRYGQRARIAPGTTATAFANFFTVSGSGCFFQNIEFYQGFVTGVAASICMTLTGERSVFRNCQFAGMNDAVSAGDTGSRNLLIVGPAGEHLFEKCTIGDDTTARTALNASVEFQAGTPRNVFDDCIFPIYVTGGGTAALILLTAAASCLDRTTLFKQCRFLCASTFSGGSAVAALATLAASSGGLVLLDNCQATGITAIYSGAGTQGQIRLAGPVQAAVLAMATPS